MDTDVLAGVQSRASEVWSQTVLVRNLSEMHCYKGMGE